MLTSDKILRSVYSSMDRAMVHSTTFKGNQLAMVAGLATLSVFDDEAHRRARRGDGRRLAARAWTSSRHATSSSTTCAARAR